MGLYRLNDSPKRLLFAYFMNKYARKLKQVHFISALVTDLVEALCDQHLESTRARIKYYNYYHRCLEMEELPSIPKKGAVINIDNVGAYNLRSIICGDVQFTTLSTAQKMILENYASSKYSRNLLNQSFSMATPRIFPPFSYSDEENDCDSKSSGSDDNVNGNESDPDGQAHQENFEKIVDDAINYKAFLLLNNGDEVLVHTIAFCNLEPTELEKQYSDSFTDMHINLTN